MDPVQIAEGHPREVNGELLALGDCRGYVKLKVCVKCIVDWEDGPASPQSEEDEPPEFWELCVSVVEVCQTDDGSDLAEPLPGVLRFRNIKI